MDPTSVTGKDQVIKEKLSMTIEDARYFGSPNRTRPIKLEVSYNIRIPGRPIAPGWRITLVDNDKDIQDGSEEGSSFYRIQVLLVNTRRMTISVDRGEGLEWYPSIPYPVSVEQLRTGIDDLTMLTKKTR